MAMNPEEDAGFESLMKPLKDLTRNWEVDLCLHLEEYINYIHEICGDRLPDINFARAAILVHNSATIYSKKVDLLFTTVLELLDTLTKKQTEAKKKGSGQDGEAGDAGEGAPSAGRKKRSRHIDLDDFTPVDDIAAERPSRLDLQKEMQKLAERKKRPQIVLNAAIKAKAKEKTSCNIYDHAGNAMGKKEEFRLNWRISSDGTLHEEFVINNNRFTTMEPIEVTVYENDNAPADESHHDYDDNHSPNQSHIAVFPGEEAPLMSSAIVNGPIDRESEILRLGEVRERREKQIVVDERDIGELAWQPNDFNHNIPEKPIKKRNVIKLPPDEKKKKSSADCASLFTVSDVLFEHYKDTSYCRDPDFGFQSKEAFKRKQQLLLTHRTKYFDYVEKMPGAEEVEEFPGFYDEDDGDNDFVGFGDPCENENDNESGAEGPLPNGLDILDPAQDEPGWKGDDANNYDNEAMRTMQAFRSRKIDHGRSTDLAKRVEAWHEKILPKLEAAEQRSSFDIHGYGTKVIDAFNGEIGSSKLFEEIVGGETREEVTRYFLASLLLANQNNVELTKTDPSELSVDCMQIKLLSTVRHHEELDENLRQTSDK